MTIPTFTYDPVENPVGTKTYRTLKAQFGDGYTQMAADGINNVYDSWALTFAGGSSDITPIQTFLDALQGYLPFYWTAPLGTQQLYRCLTGLTLTPSSGGNYVYSATFEQAFHP